MNTHQSRPLCEASILCDTRLGKAIKYLRERNMYVLDPRNVFQYRRADGTRVQRHIRDNNPRPF